MIFMNNHQILKIVQIDEESAGRYTCSVINEAGSDYRSFVLSVHQPPQLEELVEGGNFDVVEFGSTTLDCSISGGNLKWTKNGVEITESENYRISPGKRKLYILNAAQGDQGTNLTLLLTPIQCHENKIARWFHCSKFSSTMIKFHENSISRR